MTTTTLIPYTTIQSRLAAAYKDGILLVPGYPRVTVGDDPDVLIHKGKVTPTDTSKLEPYEVVIRERIGAKASHCEIKCSCIGSRDYGRACKHAALTMQAAGLIREGWTYSVTERRSDDGEHASEGGA